MSNYFYLHLRWNAIIVSCTGENVSNVIEFKIYDSQGVF